MEKNTVHNQVCMFTVSVKVVMSLRILNWNYTEELQNKSSKYYENFTRNFKTQVNEPKVH